jgi:phospholipid/cholesterol/gamma-HCH transport system substrate-binding protein
VFPVGAQARPNEVTYSEDWMRPDYVPPAAPPSAEPAPAPIPQAPLAAEAPTVSTDPSAGLPGMMIPAGAGS